MAKPRSSASKQHAADKPVIEHLAARLYKGRSTDGNRRLSEAHGRALQNALGKRWSAAANGGLPQF